MSKANCAVVSLRGLECLISYTTLVAVYDPESKSAFRTSEFHSKTTSKHINEQIEKWNPGSVFTISPEELAHLTVG